MSAKKHIIPVFVPHLGCPNDCVFCNQKRISGSLLPATDSDVIAAIGEGLKKLPEGASAELAFYGGSFTAIPAREQEGLLEAAAEYVRSGQISCIRLSTRPDAVDDSSLARLKRYGVETVELGAQSMDDGVLRSSGRGHTAADTVRAARMIKTAGFKLILQMMTGLPGSSPELDVETARRLAALSPDGVRVYPTVILRDTALMELWQSGEYAEHTVDDAVEVCSRILPIFEDVGIPVIRLGLNPTPDLSSGGAAAGAYHPALGELVRSRVLLARALVLLTDARPGGDVVIGVHPSEISAMTGQHRANVETIKRMLGLKSVKIRPTDCEKGKIILLSVANE